MEVIDVISSLLCYILAQTTKTCFYQFCNILNTTIVPTIWIYPRYKT